MACRTYEADALFENAGVVGGYNIYCNPAIDDLALYMGLIHVGLCTTCFTSMASYPSGSIFVCGG